MGRRRALELWGGLECTVARIGDRYRDQLRETGHHDRIEDLERIADLGIRTLRYPILWERVAPNHPGRRRWAWHDERLETLRDLGIAPIAGLLHHGSGPRFTSLVDDSFATLFGAYAGAVARRYPWIDQWALVNEPLTTARFSCLYGHWYPHRFDYRSFLTAVVAQCEAVLFGMRAVRRVNPEARFVQTEDVGHTFSTPELSYQADHENERRWLALDLLHGRVDRHHPWWRILRAHGVSEARLAAFLDGEARPDILGVNHYLTSERFIDQRTERYPEGLVGGNRWHSYADAEAVRVRLPPGLTGPMARLRAAWDRYGTPLAVTEAHHGCTRDEQIRWLADVWNAAQALRHEGVDVRAVTSWALFGAVDWATLLTREDGDYEPGAFDVRDGGPHPTALARAASSLARKGWYDHPVLDAPGWWRRPTRFYTAARAWSPADPETRKLAILVPSDTRPAGSALRATVAVAETRGVAHVVLRPGEMEPWETEGRLREERAWALLDLRPLADERPAPGASLASLSWRVRARGALLHRAGTGPDRFDLNETSFGRLLAVEVDGLFGPFERDPLVGQLAARGLTEGALGLQGSAPLGLTYLPDLVHLVLDLLIDGRTGPHRLVHEDDLSPASLARLLERLAEGEEIEAEAELRRREAPLHERPLLSPLPDALRRFLAECRYPLRADRIAKSGHSRLPLAR